MSRIPALSFIVALVLGLGGCRQEQETALPEKPMTIFAAASLREVLTEIAMEWARQEGHATPRLQFEASSVLARQIREGAHADVFISAAPEWVDEVKPQSQHDWLGNRLVLVVRKDAPDADLHHLSSLALAPEQVPVGKYAHAALASMNLPRAGRTIYGANVRDVLAKVSHGGAAAGIVYATDVPIDPEVRISYRFPLESHPPIVYTAGRMTEAGRGFYDALHAAWAMEIARKYGFSTLE